VRDVGVDGRSERDGGNGSARLTAFPNNLEFGLRTAKTAHEKVGASIARHRVHDLRRAHYLRISIHALNLMAGRIKIGHRRTGTLRPTVTVPRFTSLSAESL
jgi:hypothetical protein